MKNFAVADYSDVVKAIRSRLAGELPGLSFKLTHVDVEYDIATKSHRMFVVVTDWLGDVFSFNVRLADIELVESRFPLHTLSAWVERTADEVLESVRAHNARKKEQAKDAALAALGG